MKSITYSTLYRYCESNGIDFGQFKRLFNDRPRTANTSILIRVPNDVVVELRRKAADMGISLADYCGHAVSTKVLDRSVADIKGYTTVIRVTVPSDVFLQLEVTATMNGMKIHRYIKMLLISDTHENTRAN